MAHILRCLFFFEAYFDFGHSACHIARRLNVVTDALSRDKLQDFLTTATGTPLTSSRQPHQATNRQLSALDITSLEGLVRAYFAQGIATSSMKSYSSAQNRYLEFCRMYHFLLSSCQSIVCASLQYSWPNRASNHSLFPSIYQPYATCKCLQACQHRRGQTGLDSSMC